MPSANTSQSPHVDQSIASRTDVTLALLSKDYGIGFKTYEPWGQGFGWAVDIEYGNEAGLSCKDSATHPMLRGIPNANGNTKEQALEAVCANLAGKLVVLQENTSSRPGKYLQLPQTLAPGILGE